MKTKHANKSHLKLTATILLAVMGILLLTTAAFAAVKLTAPLSSYDDGSAKWENGNLTMWLNTDPQPFSEVLGFDTNDHPDACGLGTSSPWAGVVEFGHYHTDTNGAPGFQSTSNWYTVDCTSFSTSQSTQKYPTPAEKLIECVPDNGDDVIDGCELLSVDVVTACSTGNCTNEIVSTIQGNLDADCDGTIDDPTIASLVDNDALCFYWEAEKPPYPGPVWGGNLQARINAGGGDKTLNFSNLLGPSAVSLLNISAEQTPAGAILATIAV